MPTGSGPRASCWAPVSRSSTIHETIFHVPIRHASREEIRSTPSSEAIFPCEWISRLLPDSLALMIVDMAQFLLVFALGQHALEGSRGPHLRSLVQGLKYSET